MKAEPEFFVDTNLLLYAASSDSSESRERVAARRVLQGDDWGTSVQVLQEFYVNATGKLRKKIQPRSADLFIRLLLTRPTVPTTPDLFTRAVDISRRYQISYWDAAIVAAAAQLGCGTLYTQDLNPRPDLRGRDCRRPVLAGRPLSDWHR